MITWAELSTFDKFMAILSSALAITTFVFVAGYGRLWFKPAPPPQAGRMGLFRIPMEFPCFGPACLETQWAKFHHYSDGGIHRHFSNAGGR